MPTSSNSVSSTSKTSPTNPQVPLSKIEQRTACLPKTSLEELTIAQLNPFLTSEEAALQACMQQYRPRKMKVS